MVEEGQRASIERQLGGLGRRMMLRKSIMTRSVEVAVLHLELALTESCKEAKNLGLFPSEFVSVGDPTGEYGSIPLLIVGFRKVPPEGPYSPSRSLVLTEEGQLFVCDEIAWMGTNESVVDFRPSRRKQLTPDSPNYLESGLMALGELEELIREKSIK